MQRITVTVSADCHNLTAVIARWKTSLRAAGKIKSKTKAGTYFSLANTTSWFHGSFFVKRLLNSVARAFASFSVVVLAALMRSALTFDIGTLKAKFVALVACCTTLHYGSMFV